MDGLSGTGKSSIAALLANDLNLNHISSGDYFRAIAYMINKDNLIINDKCLEYLKSLNIKREGNKLFVNDIDITSHIKTKENNIESARIANNKDIQNIVDNIEHRLITDNTIIDGRDVNVRFPNADFKFYLTANSNTRISRMNSTSEEVSLSDKYDLEGNIRKSDDIIEIDTDNKTLGEIEKNIIDIIKNN
jgi:cytidylate kinase